MARGISPETNGGANLGSNTQKWNTLFAQNIDPNTSLGANKTMLKAGALNAKVRLITSGTYTAPITGIYRITLQGGGGGGGGANSVANGGGGGASGAHVCFYEYIAKDSVIDCVVGAGGAGGSGDRDGSNKTVGDNGGNTKFGNHTALGGSGGHWIGGGGFSVPNDYNSIPGCSGAPKVSNIAIGGTGGGPCAGRGIAITDGTITKSYDGNLGGGGGGGTIYNNVAYDGGNGGDGYIDIEYCNTLIL